MKTKKIFMALILLSAFLTSCGKEEKTEESIAVVNGGPILLKDFRKEVSLASRRDPTLKITPHELERILDSMIDRKVLIQEAVNRGLSEDEKFIETIKTFWEQTLLRELIAAKTKEWSDKLFVSDEEVKRHYERMGYGLTLKVSKTESEERALKFKEAMQRGEKADGEEVIGPVMFEEMQVENPLCGAFDMKEGDSGVLKGERSFIAFRILKKEPVKSPPLEEVYGRIKDILIERKKEEVLEKWLDEIEHSAKVEVNKTLLKRIENE